MMKDGKPAEAKGTASEPRALESTSLKTRRTAVQLLEAQEEAARTLIASQEQVARLLRAHHVKSATALLEAQEEAARTLLATQRQAVELLRAHDKEGAAALLKVQEEAAKTLLATQRQTAGLLHSLQGEGATALLEAQEEAARTLLALQSDVARMLRSSIDLEKRVNERNEQLTNINARLEAATIAKSTFLASMSHELRTPLNSIIGFSGILLSESPGDVNEEQKRQLEMIGNSGKLLLALINDILDLSRVEAGEFELEIGDFTLGSVVSAAVDMLRIIAQEKGLEFDASVSDPDAFLRTDRRAVEQILINLTGNAIKYTDSGAVGFDASICNDRAVFCVSDTGPGIPEEDLDAIFESFHQAGRAMGEGRPEGTGLGLSISSSLAVCLGGTITVSSTLGEGSVFTLDIPSHLDEVQCDD
ncbi:MAG: ATP-binding protein [Coriobacteriia bacterium]|nr:ATP-binding protein [Coriobacteriia bacterium]